MSEERKKFGDFGESLAAEFLERKGYKIIERNFRRRFGEIDLIAKKDGKIIFIEVKSRKNRKYGTPEEAITIWKKQRLRNAAFAFLQSHNHHDADFGIDGVFIEAFDGKYVIRHLENIVEEQ